MTNIGRFTFSVVDTTWAVLRLVLSKTNRTGDTKYNIHCSEPEHHTKPNPTKPVLYYYPTHLTRHHTPNPGSQ